MYLTATKTQCQALFPVVGQTTPVYAVVGGNVTKIVLGVSGGWIGILVSDAYTEADFLTDIGAVTATPVTDIALP